MSARVRIPFFIRAGGIIHHANRLDAAALLMDLSVAAVLFGLGRRAAELGAGALELGILGAAMPVSYTMFALATGGLSDKLGRRRVAAMGASIAMVFAFASAFTTNVARLVVINVILGFGIGLFWPALIVWVGELFRGKALSRRMARFSVAWNIGMLIGFALTGFLFERGPNLAFFVASGSIALILVLLLLPLDTKAGMPGAAGNAEESHPIPKGRGFRKTSWMANFGMTFAFFGVVALFPQLATRLGIDPGRHGMLLALWRAGALTMFLIVPHFHFWQTRLWPVWVGQAIAATAVAWIGFASNVWQFAAALFVGGLTLGFNYQASIFFTLEEMTEKGKGTGVHEATLGGGMFLGPILAGMAGNHFSLRTPYFFCAGFLAAWIALQIAIVLWRRR